MAHLAPLLQFSVDHPGVAPLSGLVLALPADQMAQLKMWSNPIQ
jgi:hypothetical protein